MEMINNWIVAVLGWFALIPQQGWAILLGLGLSGAITQWIKRTFPLNLIFPGKKEVVYKSAIRVFSLVLGFVPTYFLWPDDVYKFWAALAVGFGTPTFYKVLTFFIYRKWPQLKLKLSGVNGA